MGNVFNALSFGTPDGTPIIAATTAFVQSSSSDDMRARLLEIVAAQVELGNEVLDISLGGAGDGHSFLGTLTFRTPQGQSRMPQLDAICYVAASEAELPMAYADALVSFSARHPDDLVQWQHFGHTVVGSSAGHRFMGLVIAGFVPE